jgi:hypothetical protein
MGHTVRNRQLSDVCEFSVVLNRTSEELVREVKSRQFEAGKRKREGISPEYRYLDLKTG